MPLLDASIQSGPLRVTVDSESQVSEPGADHADEQLAQLPRRGSFLWDWTSASPPSSRGSSLHGGNFFGSNASTPSSRNSSLHGGSRFAKKRNVSFPDSGGSTGSYLWFWGQSPAPSRDSSLHGATNFASSDEGANAVQASPKELKRNSSFSFLWNWAQYRAPEDKTPSNSLHGGNHFSDILQIDDDGANKDKDKGEQEKEGEPEPAILPPKAMTKNLSMGSFMWSWGAQRTSPPSTPGNSQHGGSAYPSTIKFPIE